MSQHIPAWKRLGLKLKFAKDVSVDSEPAAKVDEGPSSGYTGISRQKRKPESLPDRTIDVVKPSKKPRTTQHSNIDNDVEQSLASNTGTGTSAGKPKRKKSVSFTAETKKEDGETAQTVQFAIPDSPGSTPKISRREKKSNLQQERAIPSQLPKRPREALEYLSRHYYNRASWKFNKNREVWILKHVLSTMDIPLDQNAMLANYVYGLKSRGARDRLASDCRKALVTLDDLSSNSETQLAFQTEFLDDLEKGRLSLHESESEEFSLWVKSQPRAKLLLLSLRQPLHDENKSAKHNGTKAGTSLLESEVGKHADGMLSNGTSITKVKKNKARTSRIELESDSSSDTTSIDESSSESDSDTESDSASSDTDSSQESNSSQSSTTDELSNSDEDSSSDSE